MARAQEARDGAGTLKGEGDVAGVGLGVEGAGVGARGVARQKHAQDATQGDAGDGNLVVEGGADVVVVKVGEFVGVEDVGIEAMDETVGVAHRGTDAWCILRRPRLVRSRGGVMPAGASVRSTDGRVGATDSPSTATGDATGSLVRVSRHVRNPPG